MIYYPIMVMIVDPVFKMEFDYPYSTKYFRLIKKYDRFSQYEDIFTGEVYRL